MSEKNFLRGVKDDLKRSFTNMSDHLGLSAFVSLLDIGFLLVLFSIFGIFVRSIEGDLATLIEFFVEVMGGATTEELLEIIPSTDYLRDIFSGMIFGFTVFFLAMWIFWGLIQGVAWHIIYRITEHEKGPTLMNYMKRYMASSVILCLISYVAVAILFGILGYAVYTQLTGQPSILQLNIISILAYAYLILIILMTSIIVPLLSSMIFKKRRLKSYVIEIKSLIMSKKTFFFMIFSLLTFASLRIAQLISELFAMIPRDNLQNWVRADILVGYILVFSILIVYRIFYLKMYERISKH